MVEPIPAYKINAENLESLICKNAGNNLRNALDQSIINLKKGDNLSINDLETNDNMHFDLIAFAAKNLRFAI